MLDLTFYQSDIRGYVPIGTCNGSVWYMLHSAHAHDEELQIFWFPDVYSQNKDSVPKDKYIHHEKLKKL